MLPVLSCCQSPEFSGGAKRLQIVVAHNWKPCLRFHIIFGEGANPRLTPLLTYCRHLQRTDEYFGRAMTQTETVSPRKKRSQRASLNIHIDAQLEDDWKHVLNRITNLFSNVDEPISQMPFEMSVDHAQTIVDLFSIGCCVEFKHPMYKWLVQLFSPAWVSPLHTAPCLLCSFVVFLLSHKSYSPT